MSFSIDMRNEATRAMVVLVTVESGLALEISTGMKTSRGRTPLTVAKANGWTNKGTKHGALLDIIALRTAIDESYQPNTHTTVEALKNHYGAERAHKEIAKAQRVGVKMREAVK